MSIDFGPFEFASAPGVGCDWIISSMGSCWGQSESGNLSNIYKAFGKFGNGKLRVSMVRHPLSWLRWLWDGRFQSPFTMSDRERSEFSTFREFVEFYAKTRPGAFSDLVLSYKADSFLRLEDLPDAFHDLMEAIGVDSRKKTLPTVPDRTVPRGLLPASSYTMLMESEKEVVEFFDYW